MRTIDSKPVDMVETESFKRLIEGLVLAASCAMELHRRQPTKGWDKCADSLRHLARQSRKLCHTKSLTRQALLADCDRIQGLIGVDNRVQ